MENASKALIFAISVLISIVIITLLLLFYNSLTSYKQESAQTEREKQIEEFNQEFLGYNRNGVRGNEIVSLANKVVDYNNRKSDLSFVNSGNENNNQNFQYMTLTINFKDTDFKNMAKNGEPILFAGSNLTYRITGTGGDFDNLTKTLKKVDGFNGVTIDESASNAGMKMYYTKDILEQLVLNYTIIFERDISDVSNSPSELKENLEPFLKFNECVGKKFFDIEVTNYKVTKPNSLVQLANKSLKKTGSKSIRYYVDQFYEYQQFKRLKFNCISSELKYSAAGRVINMSFESTGNFN